MKLPAEMFVVARYLLLKSGLLQWRPLQCRRVLVGLPLFLVLPLVLVPQLTAELRASDSGLFLDQQPLEMELSLDLKKLCRDEDQSSCEEVPARLSYTLGEGEDQDISVRVSTRGAWRLRRDICAVPPLLLDFSDGSTEGTLFAGQTMLPLSTHCSGRNPNYDQYVLKEYLAYRIYALFTDKSVRVRLVHVRYRNPASKKPPAPHNGILNEHFLSVADRNSVELWNTKRFDPSQSVPMDMATMELFQYMIGNTDFSAPAQHNIVLLRDQQGRVTTLPFDFDFSGLVNAEYAGPPENLPIDRVTQRLYRGFCNPDLDWDALFEKFRQQRTQVDELIDSVPGLSPREQKGAHKFINEFYDILDSPEKRQKNVVDACRETEVEN